MYYKKNNNNFPALGRSTSRMTLLEYCHKKYFLQYYTNTLKSINKEVRLEALLTKNLQSFPMRIGEKTHHIIADYLRLVAKFTITDTHIQALKKKYEQIMQDEFIVSAKRDYKHYDINQKWGLKEHYFQEPYDQRLQDGIKDKVWANHAIQDLLQPWIQQVLGNVDAFVQSEIHKQILEYLQQGNDFYIEDNESNFDIMKLYAPEITWCDDVVLRAAPDFGIVQDKQNYIIYDRKSWSDDNRQAWIISDQLKIYALKLLYKTKKTLKDITIHCYEVFVPSMKQYGGVITQNDIDMIQEKIRQDIDRMKNMIVERNGRKNIPQQSTTFARETASKCAHCKFRKVCAKLKKIEADTTPNHILDTLAASIDLGWLF